MRLPDWIISDTHWWHVNIIEYSGRPADHDTLMVRNWLDRVRPTDIVLHLGDVLMGPPKLWETLPELPGEVSVIIGNHDEPHKQRWITEHWPHWHFRGPFKLLYREHMVHFSHEPLEELGRTDINVHGHIHEAPAPTANHINVSVEQIDYQPVRLRELLDQKVEELDAT